MVAIARVGRGHAGERQPLFLGDVGRAHDLGVNVTLAQDAVLNRQGHPGSVEGPVGRGLSRAVGRW